MDRNDERSLAPEETVVDSRTRTVKHRDRQASALGQEIPFRMLEALLDAGGTYVSRAVLYEAAWRAPYLGKRHDNRFHYNLWRMRQLLGGPVSCQGLVERAGDHYRLRPSAPVRWLRPADESAAPGALVGWVDARGAVTNRDVARRYDCSRSTAARRLERLVRAGRLTRTGRGRGSRYAVVSTITTCTRQVL